MAGLQLLSVQGITSLASLLVLVQLLLLLCRAFYNLYLHPLSKYPGPRLWIAFPITKSLAQLKGRLDFEIRKHHERYGPVVRLGPNELSFTTAAAWKDIYGHGHAELPKYFPSGIGKDGGSTIINSDPKDHFRFRRAMLPAFSDKALDQQEGIIMQYVDLLIARLREVASSGQATNIVKWYTFTTFDLIGDLAFGTSFDGLKSGKQNRWISNIENMMRLFPVLVLATSSPLIGKVLLFFAGNQVRKSQSEHRKLAHDLTMTRINNKDMERRGDFMDLMMRAQGKEHGLTDAELASNSDTLIVAGSETTATLLCGVTYYLLQMPKSLERCMDEVRTAFDADKDITFKSASTKLPYMLACLDEALRLFPPVPTVLYRITCPGQMAIIDGHEIPEKVSCTFVGPCYH